MTCQPVIPCSDPPDSQLYALEDPPLGTVQCPQGASSDVVTLSCCGNVLTASLSGMTSSQRQDTINDLIRQCVLSLSFCGISAPTQLFGNNPQQSQAICPDGTIFGVSTPGCAFISTSQQLADSLALANAKQKTQNPICLGSIPQCLCLSTAYAATIKLAGQSQLLTWTVSGSVPPGLTVHVGTSSSLLIDGTPTASGNFTFTVTGTDASGNFISKPYTLSVIQVATTSLPAFTVGEPYSFQLVAFGGSGLYSWALLSGSFPPGISVSATGLISGTPTGLGTNPLVFTVIDASCEVLPPIPPKPQISLSPSSVTQIATVLGWSEFPGFVSSPPKKFKTVTWSGASEQQLWYQGMQIGGARYDFGGTDQIDTHGNITSNHTKNLSVMCNGATNRAAIIGGIASSAPNYSNAASFTGYFGTNATVIQPPCLINPTELCVSSSIPYALVGNVATTSPFSAPQTDLSGFWGSVPLGITEQLSFIGNAKVQFVSNVTGQCSADNGTSNVSMSPYAIPLLEPGPIGPVTTGLYLESFSSLVTPCGTVPRPADWNVSAQVIYTSTFSAVMSNEYTDAEALSNAVTVTGNSDTAVNGERTTGFVSTFVSVNFTLNCTNLVDGQSYVVTVDFQDLTSGVPTTKTYTFTATSSTNAINDSIPTPAVGHSVKVQNLKIAMT